MNRRAAPLAGIAALFLSIWPAYGQTLSGSPEPPALRGLSASRLIELAYEYAWQEDYHTERDLLGARPERIGLHLVVFPFLAAAEA